MSQVALDALNAVRAAGGEVKLISKDRLKVLAPRPLPTDLVEVLKASKADLLKILAVQMQDAVTVDAAGQTVPRAIPDNLNDDPDAFEERAAIIEYDGGIPREWAEGFAKLCTMPCPPAYRPQRWMRLIDDAGHFVDNWAPVAKKFGWTTEQVFGVDATAPEACHASRGLISLLDGRRIIEMYADRVVAVPRFGGSPITIGRCQHSGRALWELGQ